MSALITTDPGTATDWSRAAMCGVSPTMSCCERASPGAHLPHDHDSGVEPDPGLERDAEPLAEVLVDRHELVDDPKAGVHGPLGIVLVRARVAEVGDHTVAEILGRVAVEALDGTHAGVLVGAEDLAPVLGVERSGERRGVDEVAEQHGHVPSLPGAGHARGRVRDRPVLQAATAAAAEPQSGRALETAVTAPHFASATTLSRCQGKHNPAGCGYFRRLRLLLLQPGVDPVEQLGVSGIDSGQALPDQALVEA